jgi:hypothetical protein
MLGQLVTKKKKKKVKITLIGRVSAGCAGAWL